MTNPARVGATYERNRTVALDDSIPGTAILTLSTPTDLPSGSHVLVNLQATVPTDNAAVIYGSEQVLDIHSVTISDASANQFPVISDDALHVVSYFADVSGNGKINASDAVQVARVAAALDSGFASSLLADPIVVADINGDGRVTSADAARVAQFAAQLFVHAVPVLPVQAVIAGAGGASPKLSVALTRVAATASKDIYPAVDAVLTTLGNHAVDVSNDDELTFALEDAIDGLLSPSE